ncbi:MAG: hypothetical protein ONB44_23905 [candidate division KSB1 bacterium]|nr:hypothetical protein [candidate division KSB1 bacterium]MDZ7305186.1 hypothetical protein [candidate division KSB1 bacterium]MDZ7314280.1 hypothetical protein [candidate division KSB1 bacterium]
MQVEEIRKRLSVRPFRPLLIHLDNGTTHLITHPEIIITETIVVALDKDGEAVYMAPEAISEITQPPKLSLPKRPRKRRVRKKYPE